MAEAISLPGEKAWLHGPRFVDWMEARQIITRPDAQYGGTRARTLRHWRHGDGGREVLVSYAAADKFLVSIGEDGSLASVPAAVWATPAPRWGQSQHSPRYYRQVKPVAIALLALELPPSRIARLLDVTGSTIYNWRRQAQDTGPAYARLGQSMKDLLAALESKR